MGLVQNSASGSILQKELQRERVFWKWLAILDLNGLGKAFGFGLHFTKGIIVRIAILEMAIKFCLK